MGTKRMVLATAVLLALTACIGDAAETTTTSTTVPETTTTTRFRLVDGGLMGVDPATLIPGFGAQPILIADSHRGVVSPNRRWAAVEGTVDNSVTVSVIDIDTYEVTSTGGSEATAGGLTVADDGTAYWLSGTGRELIGLSPGAESASPVFGGFPAGFVSWEEFEMLGPATFGFFGISSIDNTNSGDASLIRVDVGSGTANEIALPSVEAGIVGEVEGADGEPVFEVANPSVVWDKLGNRALIAEATRNVITEVDLTTGEITEHSYRPPTDQAEVGPGTDREAVLSPDGQWFYVATRIREVESGQETSEPRDLMVFATEDWTVSAIDVNVDSLFPSPDGQLLLAQGTALTAVGDYRPSPVYVIDMASATLQIAFQTTDDSPTDVSYSRDGALAYLTTFPEGAMKIDVLDLGLMQLTGAVAFNRLSFVGEAGLLAFHLD